MSHSSLTMNEYCNKSQVKIFMNLICFSVTGGSSMSATDFFGIVSPNGAQIGRKKFFFSQQAKLFFSDFLSKVQNINCAWEGVNCMV